MSHKKYIFNEDTLAYEESRLTFLQRLKRTAVVFGVGLILFFGYSYLYTNVLGWKLPKTLILEHQNKELLASYSILNQRLDDINTSLEDIQERDNIVYRSIFGMDQISPEVRNAGFGGVERYEELKAFKNGQIITSAAMRLDILTKKAYIQSKSFDEVDLMAKRAGEMVTSVPSINPVNMKAPGTRITSSFGYRFHPIYHRPSLHSGIDIAGRKGATVVATGDGVVEMVASNYFGYGNCIVINHGFGYKTKYAHLKKMNVEKGQKVSRGEQIGELGNSGRSTGAHLHYEVIYMNKNVNPWNYLAEEED